MYEPHYFIYIQGSQHTHYIFQVPTALLHIMLVITMTTLAALGRFGDHKTVQVWAIFFALPLKSCTFAFPFLKKPLKDVGENKTQKETYYSKDLDKCKYRAFILVGLWKVLLTFCCMIALTSQYITTSKLFYGSQP